jgi:transcriptional regulator with XRE-family HTH domain
MIATGVAFRRPPFHEALDRLRVRRGLSYGELADRTGVSKRDMMAFRKGAGIPTPRQFCRLRNVVFRELAPYREDLEVQWDRAGADATETGHDVLDGAAMRDAEVALEDAHVTVTPTAEDAATFGEALRRARVVEGMSQDELGQLLGVTGQAVAHWESERNAPVRDSYSKLLDLFPVLARCPAPPTQDIAVPDGGRGGARADGGGGEQPAARFELPRLATGTQIDARPPGVPLTNPHGAIMAALQPKSLMVAHKPDAPMLDLEQAGAAYALALVEVARERFKVDAAERQREAAEAAVVEAKAREGRALDALLQARGRAEEYLTAVRALADQVAK